MADFDEETALEVRGRQADVAAALGALDGLEEDDPRYPDAFARLVQAGTALLAYEAEAAAVLERQQFEANTRSFTLALGAHMACALVVGTASALEWIGGGWLYFAIVQFLLTGGFYAAGEDPFQHQHRWLRKAAAALGVAVVSVLLLAFDVLPWWGWLLPAVGWYFAFGLAMKSREADVAQERA
ncbi:hypothetical protein AB0F18_32960 [Streptomyces sp. NPDC029216]|uniref:hypothetical protein n=1 Tax=Streptomyces sp. NPDC029216 TaxID=3154701 RepID=UPI0033C80192